MVQSAENYPEAVCITVKHFIHLPNASGRKSINDVTVGLSSMCKKVFDNDFVYPSKLSTGPRTCAEGNVIL